MPDLSFAIEGAKLVPFAASPMFALEVRVTNAPESEEIHAIVLKCQVQIDAKKRAYDDGEAARLTEIFGAPSLWARSLKSLLWTHATLSVPPFSASTIVELHVPCTYDLSVSSAGYLDAIAAGEIPLSVLFSGTIFHEGEGGALRIAQIPWTCEAVFALPARIVRETIDHYFPDCAPLALRRDVFERLRRHKMDTGAPTWECAFESLLARVEKPS